MEKVIEFKEFDNVIFIHDFNKFKVGDVTQVLHPRCSGCGGLVVEGLDYHVDPACVDLFDRKEPVIDEGKWKERFISLLLAITKMIAFSGYRNSVSKEILSDTLMTNIKDYKLEAEFFDFISPRK